MAYIGRDSGIGFVSFGFFDFCGCASAVLLTGGGVGRGSLVSAEILGWLVVVVLISGARVAGATGGGWLTTAGG